MNAQESRYSEFDDYGYESEASWEQRRKEHSKQVRSKHLPRCSATSHLLGREAVDAHAVLLTTMLEQLGCRKLVDGWLSGDDGFQYFVSGYSDTYTRGLLFSAPENKALALAVHYSSAKNNDGSGCHTYVSFTFIGQSRNPMRPDFGGAIDLYGFYNCGGSYGRDLRSSERLYSFNCPYQDNDSFSSGGLPRVSSLRRALKLAVGRIWNELTTAPIIGHVYLGTSFDGSYHYKNDPKSPDNTSYDLFWKRAGGRHLVLGLIPNASFCKPVKCIDGSYHHY